MDLLGELGDGRTVFRRALEHGADPRATAYELGYVVVRPLAAARTDDGDLELRLLVRPPDGDAPPPTEEQQQDDGLSAVDLLAPERRQRVAAYAIVRSSSGLLATEFSTRTAVPGRWGLPGGGIDPDEQPCDAVLREVAEETRQTVTLGDLVEVQTSHWVGRSPRGTVEDYHAVRLVYTAGCEQPTTPSVADVGGTTESARWVPLDLWRDVDWTAGWRQLLAVHLDPG